MKTLGILGGMSWESTATYYQLLNQGIRQRKGGLHSAPLLLESYDFALIEAKQNSGDWEGLAAILSDSARRLEEAGAQGILIATNTMHLVAEQVQSTINIPLLHIADATAKALASQGIRQAGLLGTRYTMQQPFYRERLQQHGITAMVPAEATQSELNRIIFEELCLGQCLERSRNYYREVIDGLTSEGAEGIILGCTEIGMLISTEDSPLPLFDTTTLHCEHAVAWMLD